MPNSKGIAVDERIENERIRQVGTPGLYAFFPAPEHNTGAAVLICPGGGYAHLAYVITGTLLAKWFNSLGVNAFVLAHRLPESPDLKERHVGPLEDAQRAVRLIRSNAKAWGIDPDRVGVIGTSAGGHLAATLATASQDVARIGDALDRWSFAPTFIILVSPVITMGEHAHPGSKARLLGKNPSAPLVERFSVEKQVTPATPPAFVVHAGDDTVVDVRNSLMFFQALTDNHVPASLHVFPRGGHTIAVRDTPGAAEAWTRLCEAWLVEIGVISRTGG